MNIREYLNERKLKRHKGNFLEVVHFNLYNDEELFQSFCCTIQKCGVSSDKYNATVVQKVFSDMLHKLCNTRTREFFRGRTEAELATSGRVVDSDQSLRDSLKTYSISKKR